MGMALSAHDRESYVLSTKIGEWFILMHLDGVVGVAQRCTAFIAGGIRLAHFYMFAIFLFARF
jgi:hypothetical protein